MEPIQLELFSELTPPRGASTSHAVALGEMSDASLVAAIPDAVLSDARALAIEAGRRRLGGAVTALVALCGRFSGFGVDRVVPEQVAALEALAAIGGPEAARSLISMFARKVVQGPTLAAAATAASRLGVVFPADIALTLLRHPDPAARAAACACVRPHAEITAALIGLLDDRDDEVSTAAACALGRMGRGEARVRLKCCLNERPSPRVIEAVAVIADEEAIVFLARVGRARPELTHAILSALDEIDHPRAIAVASGLKRWLSDSTTGA